MHHGAGGEVADGEVVQRQGERQHGAGDDALPDLGDDDVGEGIAGGRAQVERSLVAVLVHLLELGHDGQDDVGRVEGDVRHNHRDQPALHLGEEEQEHQRNARHDVRHGHGDVGQRHHHALWPLFHAVDTDGRERAQNGGDDGGDHRHCDGHL